MDAARSTFTTERLPGLQVSTELPDAIGQPGHCLLLDAAQDESLLTRLYSEQGITGWAVEALFLGTPQQALAGVGPHLVHIAPDSRVIASVLQRLEREPLGIVLEPAPQASWAELCEHCRQWLGMPAADGSPMLLRWFDPRWLRALLTSLSARQRLELAGPFAAFAWHGTEGWYRWSAPAALADETQSRTAFDAAFQQQLERERLWDEVAQCLEPYAAHLEGNEHDRRFLLHNVLIDACNHGLTREAEQERWLRLAIAHGPRFFQESAQLAALCTDTRYSPTQRLALLEAHFTQGVVS